MKQLKCQALTQKINLILLDFSVGIVSKRKVLSKNNVKENDIVLAIPSNGIHSNGFSFSKINFEKKKISNNLKKELNKPTKIYVSEILKLHNKNLIKSAAHITGGGLIENLLRSIPNNLSLNIDLSNIKIKKIFKWLKSNNIPENEMMRTFNCGIGFVLLLRKKCRKIKKYFDKDFKPYEIGFISKGKKKVNLFKT